MTAPWPRLGAGIAALLLAVTESLARALAEPARGPRYHPAESWPCTSTLPPTSATIDTAVTEDLLQLRGWAVWCLNELGDSFAQAIEYGQDLVADCERVLGETHPDTLTSRNNLAVAYRGAGRLDEAIPLLRAHPRRLRAGPGRDPPRHPDLPQQPRCRLPGRPGGSDEAIPLFERTLADREQVLGETHPDTLTSRNNLALAYQDAGRLDEAIPLLSAPSPTASRSWARPTPTP